MDGSSNSQPRKRANKENSRKQAPTSGAKSSKTMLLYHKRCLERIEQKLRPNKVYEVYPNTAESLKNDLKDIYDELDNIKANGVALNTICTLIGKALFHIYAALDTLKYNTDHVYDSSLQVQYYERLSDCGKILKQAIEYFPSC